MNGAIYVSDSKNSKLFGKEKVDATYASIEGSCSNTCPLKDSGCYAQNSYVGIVVSRLDKEAEDKDPLSIARAEAKAINEAYNGQAIPLNRSLRLHVSGDCRTVLGAKTVNKAVGNWKRRGLGNNVAWSYTHSWRTVPRSEWSNVEMLASIDSIDQATQARAHGYAPALVVSEHVSDKTYTLKGSDIKWIPCPNQLSDGLIGCTDCRLCFNTKRLYDSNYGIAFSAHGIKKNNIKRRLKVIQ